MGRYLGPKTKRSRRFGIRIHPKDEKIMTKRGYAPGMHGQISGRRVSEYGTQLLEKQKAKWTYGVLERQFRKYYERAAKKRGQTDLLLLQYLETRLDNLVYRVGFAQTRPQARQLVSHGFIEVNGKKVNLPSYEVRVGDTVKIRESKMNSKYVQTLKVLIVKHKAPEWIELDSKNLVGKLLSLPTRENLGEILSAQLIIEHYSR